jgi:hypothetical protein
MVKMSFSDAGRCVKYGASRSRRLFTGFVVHVSLFGCSTTVELVAMAKLFGRKTTPASFSSSLSSSIFAGVSTILGGVFTFCWFNGDVLSV